MRIQGMLLAGFSLALMATPALAQSKYARPVPPPRPIVSPYLNLLRTGGSPAFNYLTLVRPQLEAEANIDTLQKQLQGQQKTLNNLGSTLDSEAVTGHAVGFMTQSRYFMTLGRGGASATSGLSTSVPRAAAPRTTGRATGTAGAARPR